MGESLFVKPQRCVYCAMDLLAPVRPVDQIEIGKLPVDKPYKCKLSNPRNPKVHRLFFAAIAAAAKHWPENTEPDHAGDADMLRGFLLCKAGWCLRLDDFRLEQVGSIVTLIKELRAEDKYGFVKPYTKSDGSQWLAVFIPKSIRFEAADDPEFEPVKTKCFEYIETTLGCTIEQLVKADEDEA